MKEYSFDHIAKKKWRTINGEIVQLEDFLKAYGKDRMIFIGTDSQSFSKNQITKFVTAVVLYELNKGARCVLAIERVKFVNSLREKLLKEAWMSIETALYVNKIIPVASLITIDLDVSSDLKWRSNKYKEELCGMVAAQGFDYACKPNTCSIKLADKFSK